MVLSLNEPSSFPPHGLCPCCFLSLECSSPRSSCSSRKVWPPVLQVSAQTSLAQRGIPQTPLKGVLSPRLPLAHHPAVFSHSIYHFLRLSYLLVGLLIVSHYSFCLRRETLLIFCCVSSAKNRIWHVVDTQSFFFNE